MSQAEVAKAWLADQLRLLKATACFVAGTPLLTPDGARPIESFRPGDLVLSRGENDPGGPVEAKAVEEVFVNTAAVMRLKAGGREVWTTAEHPFWVTGRGWLPAGYLEPGMLLCSHDGRLVRVEGIGEVARVETVYNLRVADWHTYFVGCNEWGFSVWAHNTCEHVVEYLKSIGITNQATIDEVIQAARLSDPAGIRLAINRATGRKLSLDELIAHSNMVRSEFKLTAPIDYTGHILTAEVKKGGKQVVGGHSTATGQVRVIPGTASAPNAQGVYKAKIEVENPAKPGQFLPKTNDGGYSTLFPDSWTPARIKMEVDAAFKTKTVTGNKWSGTTPSGVKVEGYLTPNVTVYPIY